MPDHTILCRSQKSRSVQIPHRGADGPLNLLVDGAGIKVLGDGEWQARKHGVQGRRQWRKVHLAMDTATSDIRAVECTSSHDGDSPVLPELLDQIHEAEERGTVTADGAYDTRCRQTAIIDRQATPVIPIRLNGRPWKRGLPGRDRPQRNPARRPHEPLQRPRHRQSPPGGMNPMGQGGVTPQAWVAQQRPGRTTLERTGGSTERTGRSRTQL